MLIEHLWIVFVLLTVVYVLLLLSAIGAQLLDADHTCSSCGSFSERVELLLKCGGSTDIDTFPQECYALHRGVFHNVKLFYVELAVLIIFAGFVMGHGIHLIADGYTVFKPEWIQGILSRFI